MRKLTLRNLNGKDYILRMDRETIKWLELRGFSLEEFGIKPLTFFDLLWTSLFLANHKEVNSNLALKLMDEYKASGKNPSKVVNFAIEEYTAFLNALTDISSTETSEELEIAEI